jgi:hypothetical protein
MSGNGSPVEHVMQQFEPLGEHPPWATLQMRCGTVGGPGPDAWRQVTVRATPIDTEIGIYSFTCPYCRGRITWDPRFLRPPRPPR